MAIHMDEYDQVIQIDNPRTVSVRRRHGHVLLGIYAAMFILLSLFGWVCRRNSGATTEEGSDTGGKEETLLEEFDILMVEEESFTELELPGILTGDTLHIQQEPAVLFTGHLSDDDRQQVFYYTAPRDGRYGFAFEYGQENIALRLRVSDSAGVCVVDTYQDHCSCELNAGATYELLVRPLVRSGAYTLELGVQQAAVDISSAPTVCDQVNFYDQKNRYTFTPAIDGLYHFELAPSGYMGLNMMMEDQQGSEVLYSYTGSESAVLKAGETYELQVWQSVGLGSYTMEIGFQKETADLTGADTVYDSVQYEDQINRYTFTPPVEGLYRFDLSDPYSSLGLPLTVGDAQGNVVMDGYEGCGNVQLRAGETYQVQVRQNVGLGSYVMRIGYQSPMLDITEYDVINDTMTFSGQQKLYQITSSYSGEMTATVDFQKHGGAVLSGWDQYGQRLFETRSMEQTFRVEAGQAYILMVEQSVGYGIYGLRIS